MAELKLALLLVVAALLLSAAAALASPDLVPVTCKRSDNSTYGSTPLAFGSIVVRADPNWMVDGTFVVNPFAASNSFSWNPGLWHFFYRYYTAGVRWASGSQNASFALHVARLNFSYNLTLLNPSPSYQPPPWSVARVDGDKSFAWPNGWGWTGTGREYSELQTLIKAEGAAWQLALRQLVIEVTVYGGQGGAAVEPGYSIWLNVQCYNETSGGGGGGGQPPGQGVTLKTSVSGCAEIDPAPGTYSYAKGSAVTVRGRPQSGATWQGMYIRPAGGGSWSWLPCEWQSGWCVATVTMDQSYEVEASARCPPRGVRAELNFTAPFILFANATIVDPDGRVTRTLWPLSPQGWLWGYERSIPNPSEHGQCYSVTWSVTLKPLDYSRVNYTVYSYLTSGYEYGPRGSLLGGSLTATVTMGKCMAANRVVYAYATFTFSNGTSTVSTCADTTWWSRCRWYAFKDRVHVTPLPSNYTLTIQVYKATASGATLLPANGTRVRVGSAEYAADPSGRVSVTLQQGSYEVEVLTTYYGPQLAAEGSVIGWRRYRFWRWSDNVVSNPRTINLNRDTTLTVYVWDERALLVRWEPHFDGDAWGVVNATSGARFRHGELVWLPVGGEARLLPVEGGGALFTYWLLGSECIRGSVVVSDPYLKLTVNQTGISATAVFRLAATNQTVVPPGAAVANPITYVPGTTPGGEERMGRKGWWLVTVTHVVTNKTSPAEAGIDEKTWIYALLAHANGSSRWAPVAGTWKLHLAQDWDPSKHVRDLPGGVKIIEWDQSTVSDFPKVQEPQEWRDWYFVTLAAWRTVFEEAGGTYNTAGLWLENGTTLALYNISFTYMGVNGSQVEYAFWQPLTVSTLTFRAEAVYTLTSHVAAPPGRRSIYMYIYVNATWKYVPPQRWQLLGFKVHAPQLGFLAVLDAPGCGKVDCVGYWAPPSQTGATWRLYVISLGDTEDFYAKPYPSGLFGDGYSSVREFRLSMRWLGAGGRPSTLIWGSDKVTFRLAPASVYRLDWADPRGPFTATWGCFAQGPSGLTPISSYKADITFDWGATGSTHPLKGSQVFKGVSPPATLHVQVPADDWIAFYPIPEGGRYAIAQGALVPVPLVAKYPPRAGG